MPRRGQKVIVSVWVCSETGHQCGHTYLNAAKHTKRIERRRFNPYARKHTLQFTRPEKSGSLGLARNK